VGRALQAAPFFINFTRNIITNPVLLSMNNKIRKSKKNSRKIRVAVPVFNRGVFDFNAVFGADPRAVISRIDKNNDDIPNQVPAHRIEIRQAGVVRENVPLRVLSPLSKKEQIVLNSRLEIFTRISKSRRGLHISRIGNVVALVSQNNFKHIEDFILAIARDTCKSQGSDETKVKLTAPFSFYEDVLYMKNRLRKSLEHITLIYSVTYKNGKSIFDAGLEFNNITACPCVQQTFKHTLLERGGTDENIRKYFPLLTHSQRCKTKILIKSYTGHLNIAEILKIVDVSSVRVQNTLPREHELNMVYRAHNNPKFMEDTVRDIAFNIFSGFKDKYPNSSILINTDSMESIHDFNIQAKIEESFKSLEKLLK